MPFSASESNHSRRSSVSQIDEIDTVESVQPYSPLELLKLFLLKVLIPALLVSFVIYESLQVYTMAHVAFGNVDSRFGVVEEKVKQHEKDLSRIEDTIPILEAGHDDQAFLIQQAHSIADQLKSDMGDKSQKFHRFLQLLEMKVKDQGSKFSRYNMEVQKEILTLKNQNEEILERLNKIEQKKRSTNSLTDNLEQIFAKVKNSIVVEKIADAYDHRMEYMDYYKEKVTSTFYDLSKMFSDNVSA